MKRTICAFLSLILLFTLFPFSYAVADDSLPFEDDPKAIQTASNSVIMLSCYDKKGNLYATGSAFAAFEEGVFITNCHVIEGGIYAIRAQMETGFEFSINSVVAYDADKDIAILRTEAKTGLDPLPIGSTAALERGEKVIAIGSPLGLINTLSIGLYSGTVKDDRDYLQFSAAISHGSSGGALFNNHGEVVGITTASYTEGQNLNLAIPIEDAVELWETRDKAEELSIADFYDEWKHLKSTTVSYVVSHPDEFDSQEVEVSGYYYPHEGCFYLLSSESEIEELEKLINDYNKLLKQEGSVENTYRQLFTRKNHQEILDNNAIRVFLFQPEKKGIKQGDFIIVQGSLKGKVLGSVICYAAIVG